MKTLLKLLSCLTICCALLSCHQEPDNSMLINTIIALLPGEPIDRNNTVSVSNVINLQIDKENDFSDYEGKKAFMIVMNENAGNWDTFKNISTVSDNSADSLFKSDNQYVHIPFNPPKVNYLMDDISEPLLSRNISKTENQSELQIGDTRNFYASTANYRTNNEWAKDSVLKAMGNHCYIWFKEKEGINVTQDKLDTLARTFDSIYEKETYIFGKNTLEKQPSNSIINITDEDIKINIIVYDLFNDLETTKVEKSGTFGYFYSLDFQNSTETKVTDEDGNVLYTLNSNRCQCLHIDSYFLEIATEAQQSTIAHEFQHLLHYVNKSLKYGLLTSSNGNKYFRTSDTWFNEMMSMVCEDIMQSQLGIQDKDSPKSRLSIFNAAHYKGFEKWRDNNDVFISYANAYAFGAYLLRNYGIDFIKTLATNNYINEDAITRALIAVNARERSFKEALDLFYNVVLNPKGTYYTLNQTVSKNYTIAGNSVTFNCDAINLFDYLTIPKDDVNLEIAGSFYQASKYNDYYGPIILNNRIYKQLDGYGMFVSYMGIVGEDFNKKFKLTKNQIGDSGDTNIKYKLAFIN